MKPWIQRLLEDPHLAGGSHDQRVEDANLGLGWVYYALARVIRPKRAVVIGSYRGFSPLVFAKALVDNRLADDPDRGRVLFIDPSMVDDFWTHPEAVQSHFASHGIDNIDHRLMTTQEFVETEEYKRLDGVGLVFIDGYHTAEQAAFDFGAFEHCLSSGGMILLHDSVAAKTSTIYGPGREYQVTVVDFVAELKARSDLQVFDLPLDGGVTLVRRCDVPDRSGAIEGAD